MAEESFGKINVKLCADRCVERGGANEPEHI